MLHAVSSRSRIIGALALTVVAAPPVPVPGRGPTPAQVRAAVRRAERSRQLWATINICNTRRHRDALGVRGQMPALGFPASLSMNIQVEYWSSADGRFKPDPYAKRLVKLGRVSFGVEQGGHIFQFGAHAGLLSGVVTFEWARAGRLLGRATRATTRGHRDVDFGDPRRYSAATCAIR